MLETRLDRHKGVVASGIVRCGTLKRGQPFVVATVTGKVRWLYDSEGKALKEALPGHAVELTGFDAKEVHPHGPFCSADSHRAYQSRATHSSLSQMTRRRARWRSFASVRNSSPSAAHSWHRRRSARRCMCACA